jgi:16S rRNA (uracil1498-N3)-methyltransferase
LFKFDRLEWLLEKATELGVNSVCFVKAERSENGLDKAAEKRIERWRKIAVEASQQSRRLCAPELYPVSRFKEAIRTNADSQRLFLDEDRSGPPLIEALSSSAGPVALLVGPEGGWTGSERSEARDAGWLPVSMGANILRTETAAMAALAVVNAVRGR